MSEQEAQELIARVRTKGSYTGDYYMSFADSSAPFNADIDILAEALLKQIPKKPTRKGYRDGCPICSVVFRENDIGIPYCWNCGTKLDWSDDNGD